MQPAGSLRRTRVVPSANRAPIAVLSRRVSNGQRAGAVSCGSGAAPGTAADTAPKSAMIDTIKKNPPAAFA